MPPWATVIDCSIYSVLTNMPYIYIYIKAATYSRSYVAQHESIGNNWNSSQDTSPLEHPFCHQHRHRSPSSIQIVAMDFFFGLRWGWENGHERESDFAEPSRAAADVGWTLPHPADGASGPLKCRQSTTGVGKRGVIDPRDIVGGPCI